MTHLHRVVLPGDVLALGGRCVQLPQGQPRLSAFVGERNDRLEAGGSSLDRLVKTTVFLADMRLFEAMNAVYREMIPEPRPGRSTVEARLARPELLVEIEGIAVVD